MLVTLTPAIESWARHKGIGSTQLSSVIQDGHNMLWQVGQLQRLTVHTDQGQHMLCGDFGVLSHDKIWMGLCDLGGACGSFW